MSLVKPFLKLFTSIASTAANTFAPGSGALINMGANTLIDRIQDNTAGALPDRSGQNGSQTVECGLTNTARDFSTRLGKKYAGYTVIRNPTGNAVIEDPAKNNGLFINLKTNVPGPISVTISVF